jgi:hypothetical protein
MARGAAAAASGVPSDYRTDAQERADAVREFARFDQGPMSDMPSAMPEELDEDEAAASPSVPRRRISRPEIPGGFPQSVTSSPPQTVANVAVPIEDHHDPEIVHDRWAHIRENAAKRTTARASEEQSRASQALSRTDDGDETSGEESKL